MIAWNQSEWFIGQGALGGVVGVIDNPCIRAYGPGPAGAICKTCKHLFRKKYSKVYIKCDLRPDTNGPATDHRANWPACAKFEPCSAATNKSS